MLVTFLVVAYSLCSSMLLILNKVSIAALVTPLCVTEVSCRVTQAPSSFQVGNELSNICCRWQ